MISENSYDYPQYWDLAFRDETPFEADFIEAAAQKYCTFKKVKRLLEPGCGGGRMIVEMASRGYEVAGIDLSEQAIHYVRKRLQRRKLSAKVDTADMRDFKQRPKVDIAYCLVNTFRHLLTETDAVTHLQSVAKAVRRGGLYIIGLHLLPPDADEEDGERWTAKHGRTQVTMTLRVLEFHRRERYEVLRFNMRVRSHGRDLRFRTDYRLRIYTAAQIRSLLQKVPEFELLDVFDFNYDIDEPLALNNELGDTVLVLKRR